MQEKRHIGAQRRRDLMKFLLHQGMVEEFVKSLEDSGGITAPTAETRPMGDLFHECDPDAMIEASGCAERLGSLHAEIIASPGKLGVTAEELDPLPSPVTDLDLVGQTDGGHQGLKLMKAVRTLSQNTERKVDLGRSGE